MSRGGRAARIDANQPYLVELMRGMGASVAITSAAGDGFTDLVVGWGGVTVLAEVKDGDKVPSKRQLTNDQKVFHASFRGAITIIETPEQAAALVNMIREVAARLGVIDWNMGAVASHELQREHSRA